MAAEFVHITYRFHLERGVEEIPLRFRADDFTLCQEESPPPADWARLDFHQCRHCPLTASEHALCPFAHALSGFVARFDDFQSYETALIEAVTEARTVTGRKPLQHGMASVVGLIGATSGCPHLAFFRPMARFHLPFASDDETLYRVFSMYLLGRFLRQGRLHTCIDTLDELRELHGRTTLVNQTMAARIRAAFHKDVVVNAIVILDSFAQSVPALISHSLDELRELYGPSLAPPAT